MMTLDINRLHGQNVVDQDGDKVGSIGQVYLDDETDRPTFVTVKTGLFGNNETFVPLDMAQNDGDDLRVPYTKDFIKDAPNVDADGHLSEQQQDEIYRYYQLDGGRAGGVGDGRIGNDGDRDRDGLGAAGAAGGVAGRGGDVDRDLDGDRPGTGDRDRRGFDGDDNSVVRREEELKVGKERVETGRVRLRKHVVTEQKTVTVPVEREEFEVVREPIADGDGSRGGQLGDDEVSVSLSEERPVVDKEVVDKERVGLQTNKVQDERRVDAEVGREEVVIDEDGRRGVDGDRDDNRGLADKAKDKARDLKDGRDNH